MIKYCCTHCDLSVRHPMDTLYTLDAGSVPKYVCGPMEHEITIGVICNNYEDAHKFIDHFRAGKPIIDPDYVKELEETIKTLMESGCGSETKNSGS